MTDFIAGVTKRRKVNVSEIQKSYIISELSKAVSEKDERSSFVEKLKYFLDPLFKSEIRGLTKILSDYRGNAVYRYTTVDLDWYEIEVRIENIYLTSTNPEENVILRGLSPSWNLACLIEKIQKGETEGLEHFLDNGVRIGELAIAVYKKENDESKIELIDGMHRTPPLIIRNGQKNLVLYLGIEQ